VLAASWETKGFYEPPRERGRKNVPAVRPLYNRYVQLDPCRGLPPDRTPDRFSSSGNRAGETGGGFHAPLIARSIAVCTRVRARESASERGQTSLSIITRKSNLTEEHRALSWPPTRVRIADFGSRRDSSGNVSRSTGAFYLRPDETPQSNSANRNNVPT